MWQDSLQLLILVTWIIFQPIALVVLWLRLRRIGRQIDQVMGALGQFPVVREAQKREYQQQPPYHSRLPLSLLE